MCTQSSGGGVATFIVVRIVVMYHSSSAPVYARPAYECIDQCDSTICTWRTPATACDTITHETASTHVSIDSATPSTHAK